MKIPEITRRLALLAAGLAVLPAGLGVFARQYGGVALELRVQLQGQDLVTLVVAIPVTIAVAYRSTTTSRRLALLLGMLGYLAYTYGSYALLLDLSPRFLLHVGLFALAFFGFATGVLQADADRMRAAFRAARPRVGLGIAVLVLAGAIGVLWVLTILGSSLPGAVAPETSERLEGLKPIFFLDLGLVVPLGVTGSVLLIRDRPWGYVLTPIFVVKAAALFLALTIMTAFLYLAGLPPQGPFATIWITSLALSAFLLYRFLRPA